MYAGQGNYAPQFRPPSVPSPPPYQQASSGPAPPFLQTPPGPIPPPVPQAPPYFGRSMASQAQPVHFPHPPVNSSQPYLQPPPPPPLPPPPPPPPPTPSNGNASVVPPYPLAGLPVPMPLPPAPRMLQPPLVPNSHHQGQAVYHSLHPPHPGIPHAPPRIPWPANAPNPPPSHPNLEFTIPTPFRGKNPAIDAHPPAILPPPPGPPPPPPPPPSSPPPLPPSPPASTPVLDVIPSDPLKALTTDSKEDSNASDHIVDNAPVHHVDIGKGFREGNKAPLVDGEASENIELPPPRPDEVVVRSIEVLCQFIVKVGPDFEITARAKEVGNPHFSFLFGGEPGSAAAIGHEYFQWMKKKYVAVMESPKGVKHNILPLITPMADVSSQAGNLECVDAAHSPAISDMDMEDDITPADTDKGYGNTNEESDVSTRAVSHASDNAEEQFQANIHVASEASSPAVSLVDAEDEKESLVFEDVSPERSSPDTAGLGDRTPASSRFPIVDSIKGELLSNTENVNSQVVSGVFLKSPFRLIQDYASDESEEIIRSGNDEDFNPMRLSPATATATSELQQEKQSELCSNYGGQDFTEVPNESGYNTALCQLSPSMPQGTRRSPEKSSPSVSIGHFDIISKTVDPDIHPVEHLENDGRETFRPSEYDDFERRKINADQENVELNSKESLMEKQAFDDVDEFGRLIRKDVSPSDSDESQYGKRRGKKGRNWSRSMSRSPQGSRMRRRSRSPRRRDKRSRSRSWSPKRGRSRSPPLFRPNMSARHGRDLLHECLDFNRGKCFRGASCRYLHRDFRQHPNMQRRYPDPRKPRYHNTSDDAFLPRIGRRDNICAADLHPLKSEIFVDGMDYEKQVYEGQYDARTDTVFHNFSDEKDKVVPTSETEDTINQASQEAISRELEPPVEHILASVEGESTGPPPESSEPKKADNCPVHSSGDGHALFQQPSSGGDVSFQASQSTTHDNASEAEKSSQLAHVQSSSSPHHSPDQISLSANDSIQDLTRVGENIAVETTTHENIATSSYSHGVTSIKPSIQPLHEEFLQPLLPSGANLQSSQPLFWPPHEMRPMRMPSNSLTGLSSSQHFRENVIPPMTSYQSQPAPSHTLYPPRPPFPDNPFSNNPLQPNLAWSDLTLPPPQNMFALLSRPPFPSSEMPLRNDFMPSARPYPSGDFPRSRPSDFFPPSFHSVSSCHPPRHQSFPNEQGIMQLQNQRLAPASSMPLVRSFHGEEIFMPRIRDAHHSHPPLLRYPDNYFQPQPSDGGLSIFPIKEHVNPFASTFENPLRGSGIHGPEIRRYDSAPSSGSIPILGIGFGMRASPNSSMRLGEQILPKVGSYVHESFAEVIPDSKKLLVQEPVTGAPYDPLFDSIEPSPDTSKIRVEEQNSGINDTGSASKLNSSKLAKLGSKKHKGGSVTELKAEVDEFGEVATDADAGGVENESPQLLDKDWSPGIPFDDGEINVGEIEISQVRSPGKSKKNRDSRSMRLFKIALADFAKEVLKPSWRQGNLSKEAFKTIVKKTVDKVAGAVPSHHIPKSQSKINQYVESSQRKLTKLVMGYVDKYVKL
ncbi:uncharacterized protein LOC110019536 [Phalaenopsis equestris]|uniref:uncharacterized protein LOC110019536 n=1 Tax=Phalaenopsis equestris TaxID=78828 RepID=UPI0009E61630|nr:uncharacterized protein LOC110019536 [Phalaenopsis equestris]XP_020572891.1 uncharacterized protein LOC110019536 [Phalaenopsis equestris]